jgi:hypothetical protein
MLFHSREVGCATALVFVRWEVAHEVLFDVECGAKLEISIPGDYRLISNAAIIPHPNIHQAFDTRDFEAGSKNVGSCLSSVRPVVALSTDCTKLLQRTAMVSETSQDWQLIEYQLEPKEVAVIRLVVVHTRPQRKSANVQSYRFVARYL